MIDLYYWPTPNGKKVAIFLEETGTPYKLVPINIGRGDQFKPEYLKLNPNHRMPAIVDHEPSDGGAPLSVFESGAILLSGGKDRQALAAGPAHEIRSHPMGDLADGEPGSETRRGRTFPPSRRPRRRSILRRAARRTNRPTASMASSICAFVTGAISPATISPSPTSSAILGRSTGRRRARDINEFKHFKRWFEEIGRSAGCTARPCRRCGPQHRRKQALPGRTAAYPKNPLQPARIDSSGLMAIFVPESIARL